MCVCVCLCFRGGGGVEKRRVTRDSIINRIQLRIELGKRGPRLKGVQMQYVMIDQKW